MVTEEMVRQWYVDLNGVEAAEGSALDNRAVKATVKYLRDGDYDNIDWDSREQVRGLEEQTMTALDVLRHTVDGDFDEELWG